MSTTVAQSQLGYAAQASPPVVTAGAPFDRFSPPKPAAEPINVPKPEPKTTREPNEPPTEKAPPVDTARTMRKTDVDWQTNELVYRVIDNRSGQVVSQSPDEALLRLRAYAKQALTQSAAEQAMPKTVSREM